MPISIGGAFPKGFPIAWLQTRAMELRPLDLGGIFVRSATLYARNFVPLISVAVAAIVPVSIVQYFIMLRVGPQLDEMIRTLTQPGRNAHLPALLGSRDSIGLTAASVVLGYLMLAFAISAVAVGVARLYGDERVTFWACCRPVLSRGPAIVLLLACALVILGVAYAAAFGVVAIPISIAALISPNWVLVIMPFALTLILLVVTSVLAILVAVSSCGFCGIVIEKRSALEALRTALRRVCSRKEMARALLCSTVVSAIALAATIFADLVAFVGLGHWPAAYMTVDALARAVVVPFVGVVLAVYYFDIRIRYEGFDIESPFGSLARADDSGTHPTYAATRYLSGHERELVASFLARRDEFTPARRRAIAAALAGPARERVPAELQRLDDESLLERL